MRRYLLVSILSLALVSCVLPPEKNSSVRNTDAPGTGLLCFSMTPARDGPPTCDELCASKGAGCTGITINGGRNPGASCMDAPEAGNIMACRCCAAGH